MNIKFKDLCYKYGDMIGFLIIGSILYCVFSCGCKCDSNESTYKDVTIEIENEASIEAVQDKDISYTKDNVSISLNSKWHKLDLGFLSFDNDDELIYLSKEPYNDVEQFGFEVIRSFRNQNVSIINAEYENEEVIFIESKQDDLHVYSFLTIKNEVGYSFNCGTKSENLTKLECKKMFDSLIIQY